MSPEGAGVGAAQGDGETQREGERPESLTSWHDDWSGLRVAVLGLGMTGFSVADTLAELRAVPLVFTGGRDEDRERILAVLGVDVVHLDEAGGRGGVPDAIRDFSPELVVASPGFHPDHPVLEWATSSGIPVWGDIELAWRLRDKTGRTPLWLGVTGTNGKTTVTQMAAHMVHAAGLRVAPCGNIGVPVLDAIRDPEGFDVLVVECSSYQLHSTHTVAADAAVVTNLADDHLDWHGSAEAYRTAKGRIYEHAKTACIYNLADTATRRLVEIADVAEGCRAIGVGLGAPGPSDFGIVDGILVDRAFLDERRHRALEIGEIADLRERGLDAPHLVFDVLAAAALARAIGVPPAKIQAGIRTFAVDRHRRELVAEVDGVAFVNDSKATNAHAADASLSAVDHVVWLVGGLLKGVDPAPLVAKHAHRLRGAVILGEQRDEVVAAFAKHAPNVPVVEVDSGETASVMSRAVQAAVQFARSGDTVLLAPAAASMDQFASYGDRGDAFVAAVQEWEGCRDASGEHPNRLAEDGDARGDELPAGDDRG